MGHPLTGRQERAARLVAADRLSDELIARDVGIAARTLYRWKRRPHFAERVAAVRAEIRQEILQHGIADPVMRVRALQDRWERMERVILERAADARMREVPGGQTGLMVRQVRTVGVGKDAQIVEEYTVDTGLLAELRAHEQQAAKELGQWAEKVQHVGADGQPIPGLVITIVDGRTERDDPSLSSPG